MKKKHYEMRGGEEDSSPSEAYEHELDKQHLTNFTTHNFSRFKELAFGLLAFSIIVLISHLSLSSTLKGMDNVLRTVQSEVDGLKSVDSREAGKGGRAGEIVSSSSDCPKIDFKSLGEKYGTDKVTFHHYYHMYEKYLSPRRCDNLIFLEIGLGCDMTYGPGASYRLWLEYFPNAKIYFIEYDDQCVKKWEDSMKHDRAKIFSGDQADVDFLDKVIKEVGQEFDFIVDDGGHFMYQQVASFEKLFLKLKAGSQYFIEDLECSFEEKFTSGVNAGKIMINYVKDIINDLITRNYIKSPRIVPISSWVLGVDCMEEVCAFTKGSQKE
jgi:hypothetical protein